MSERTAARPGILESAAIVLAIAVACLAVARAQPGPLGCAATLGPASHAASTPAKPAAIAAGPETVSHDVEATDMLLHD